MPTAIAVTSPDLALPATDRQTPAAVVLRAPGLQPLDEALTETGAVLEHHGHLIVLYSAACPPEHVRRLHTLRALLESDRIAIVPLELPPLGVAVLARQLRQLSLSALTPGVLACAARLLAHYIHAGALLGTVSGLDRVPVDLRSHVTSWLPGAQFAVLAHPEPQLVRLERNSTTAGLKGPTYGTQLATARGHFAGDWVSGVLAPSWQVQGGYEVPLPAESAQWWGTRKLVEFAAAIPDPALLHRLVSSVRREACRWCGLELIGDRCAFCATPLPARDSRTAGGRAVTAARAPGGAVAAGPGSGGAVAAIAGPPPAGSPLPGPPAPPPPGPAAPAPPHSPPTGLGLSPVALPGVPGTRGRPAPGGPADVRGPDALSRTGGPYGPADRPFPSRPAPIEVPHP
ncbi:hypothetical protein [Streptomyces sp. NPDC048644]|uniref:hypothetical protein n=1 Tax=Streptomyces sp. NPDC048644 TaxID=3365582 RepID=UPI0037137862